jgi:prevent-host-death family protein
MQTSIGAFEAKTHFSQLIKRATQGEEILITHRGKPIAKIIPATPTHNVEAARAAAFRLRSLAKQMALEPFCWDEWKNYRDQGRK